MAEEEFRHDPDYGTLSKNFAPSKHGCASNPSNSMQKDPSSDGQPDILCKLQLHHNRIETIGTVEREKEHETKREKKGDGKYQLASTEIPFNGITIKAPVAQNQLASSQSRCCCLRVQIKKATFSIALISAFFVVCNFLAKILGYSEIDWNFELLFLVVDSVAIVSLIYGVYSERPAFLQPFVIVTVITISFLLLLAIYMAMAAIDPSSYAGQDLESELHKRLSEASQLLSMGFDQVVTVFSSVALVVIFVSILAHSWFIILSVRCARYFRQLHMVK